MEDTGITVVSGCLRLSPISSLTKIQIGHVTIPSSHIESHRVTSSHIESSEACNILVAPSWALPMAQAASVFQGQRWQRWHSEFIVNSWSLARFVPVCLKVSFKRRSYATLFFCPATYLVKVPEGSWSRNSRSKHGKVWRFHIIWYIYGYIYI